MKITSWNVLYKNKNILKGVKQLLKQSDILCLQEVPPHLLDKILKFTKYSYSGLDTYRIKKNKEILYCVILSKYKITFSETVSTPKKFKDSKKRKKLLKILKIVGCDESSEECGINYIDIKINKEPFRIITTRHKLTTSSNNRVMQFKEVLKCFNKKSTNIVCADLNIFENKIFKPLSLFLGSSFREVFLESEREKFEEIFKKNNLLNSFRNETTITIAKNQSDHILIPKEVKVLSKEISKNSLGSDHYPISVEININ